jgi:lactoylglutathione lyase
VRKFITPENDYGELATGQTTISFASIALANSNLKNGFTQSHLQQKLFGIELGFVTDNIPETIANAINASGILLEQPIVKPWGQTVAYLQDIYGFLIEICTAMAH